MDQKFIILCLISFFTGKIVFNMFHKNKSHKIIEGLNSKKIIILFDGMDWSNFNSLTSAQKNNIKQEIIVFLLAKYTASITTSNNENEWQLGDLFISNNNNENVFTSKPLSTGSGAVSNTPWAENQIVELGCQGATQNCPSSLCNGRRRVIGTGTNGSNTIVKLDGPQMNESCKITRKSHTYRETIRAQEISNEALAANANRLCSSTPAASNCKDDASGPSSRQDGTTPLDSAWVPRGTTSSPKQNTFTAKYEPSSTDPNKFKLGTIVQLARDTTNTVTSKIHCNRSGNYTVEDVKTNVSGNSSASKYVEVKLNGPSLKTSASDGANERYCVAKIIDQSESTTNTQTVYDSTNFIENITFSDGSIKATITFKSAVTNETIQNLYDILTALDTTNKIVNITTLTPHKTLTFSGLNKIEIRDTTSSSSSPSPATGQRCSEAPSSLCPSGYIKDMSKLTERCSSIPCSGTSDQTLCCKSAPAPSPPATCSSATKEVVCGDGWELDDDKKTTSCSSSTCARADKETCCKEESSNVLLYVGIASVLLIMIGIAVYFIFFTEDEIPIDKKTGY